MSVLKKTKKGFVIVSVFAISNKLAKSFEYCGTLKKRAILENFPLFNKLEIKDDSYHDKKSKIIVVKSKEIRSTNLDRVNKLSKIQDKAVKAIIKKEAASIILDGIMGEVTNQLIKIDETKIVLYCPK